MIIDCHTHSRNSFDADNDTVKERCQRAIQLGLDAMAITDHCEVNRFYEKEYYHKTKKKNTMITVSNEHMRRQWKKFLRQKTNLPEN